MVTKVLLFCGAMLVVMAPNARASAFVTAGKLKSECELLTSKAPLGSADAISAGACGGFMEGYMSCIRWTADTFVIPGVGAYRETIEEGVTVGQVIRVYLLWMEKHPESENKEAAFAVTSALAEAKLMTSSYIGPAPK